MHKLIRTSLIAVSLALTIGSAPAYAGGGGGCHFHGSKPAEQETVIACAVERKDGLVKAGKIDGAWKAVQQDKVEQIDGKKGKEWKVTFRDPAAKDKSKQALYMFFSLPGNFLAANFTGQ